MESPSQAVLEIKVTQHSLDHTTQNHESDTFCCCHIIPIIPIIHQFIHVKVILHHKQTECLSFVMANGGDIGAEGGRRKTLRS